MCGGGSHIVAVAGLDMVVTIDSGRGPPHLTSIAALKLSGCYLMGDPSV